MVDAGYAKHGVVRRRCRRCSLWLDYRLVVYVTLPLKRLSTMNQFNECLFLDSYRCRFDTSRKQMFGLSSESNLRI